MKQKYLLLSLPFLVVASLNAATRTYDGANSNVWGGDAWVEGAYADGSDIVFAAPGYINASTLLSGATGTTRSVNSITYNSNASPGNSFTISTSGVGTLAIGAGGITAVTGTASQTFATPVDVNLAASQTWTNNGVGSLLFNSKITGAGTNSLNLAAGTIQLTNSGNSFAGNLVIDGGTLNLNAGGLLPHGNVTINSGGSLVGGGAFGTVSYAIAGGLGQTTIVNSGGIYDMGNLDLVVSFDAAPTLGSYTLIDASTGGSINGTNFRSVDLPTGWNVVYGADSVSIVPEPSQFTAMLAGVAFAMVVIRRRKRS